MSAPAPVVRPNAGRTLTVRSARVAVSLRLRVRTAVLIAAGGVVLVGAALWSLLLGTLELSVSEVVRAVADPRSASSDVAYVVHTLRLPRTLSAALAGAAFAASGAVFQGLVRNPLVSPDIIGINAGASVVTVFWILVFNAVTGAPIGAFVGALGAAFAIYGLAWRRGVQGGRLILVGIGVSAVLSAGTTFMMVRFPIERVSNAVRWSAGTLYGTSWGDVVALAIGLVLLLPLGLWLARRLALLQLGDETAAALGVPVERVRSALLAVGAGLAAVGVAAGGPIGFVALVSPHIARMLAGPVTSGVLALSAVIGALLLTVADIVAQHAFALSIPVGIVTGAVGAPYFLFLLYRTNRSV